MIGRRAFVASLAGSLAWSRAGAGLAAPADRHAQPFNTDLLLGRARALASQDFVDDQRELPKELADLDYDAVRDIRFRSDKAMLADGGSDFRLQFFHLSPLAPRPVDMYLVREGTSRRVAYDRALFDYGGNKFRTQLPRDLGFAGLRIHYPVNRPDVLDELAVFLGATYYRFLGRGQHYGLSARALAINSGGVPEEFPFFRELYVEEPQASALSITVHGLFDGPSASGTCSFTITPQDETRVAVVMTIIPRVAISRLGIAPLTSMFFAGESDRRAQDEFRREIHDSDGLSIETGAGERIWRPLRNPAVSRISSFEGDQIRGFGLMQRERNWSDYSDLEAKYERRPDYWVSPQEDWGPGKLELVELTAPDEAVDNIVAFWTPQEAPEIMVAHRFAYQLTASLAPQPQATARVRNTMISDLPEADGRRRRMFIIDFQGGDLPFWLKELDKVEAETSAEQGAVMSRRLVAHPHIEGVRVFLDVSAAPGDTCDMRVVLRTGQRTLSETWTESWAA